MQLGMIGLGRMGANMVRRLMRDGHECVVYDHDPRRLQVLARRRRRAPRRSTISWPLKPPRAVWLMVPAAVVDETLDLLAPKLAKGDAIIDGGNSYYIDDIRRAKALAARRHPLRRRGHQRRCLGPRARLLPDDRRPKAARAASRSDLQDAGARPRHRRSHARPGEARAAPRSDGYLHCGPSGAGHFVKMVHNGIEYGIMAAYAEGFNILHHANVGKRERTVDAETTPCAIPSTTSTTWTCPTSPRCGVAAAWWPRGCWISPPSRCSSSPI